MLSFDYKDCLTLSLRNQSNTFNQGLFTDYIKRLKNVELHKELIREIQRSDVYKIINHEKIKFVNVNELAGLLDTGLPSNPLILFKFGNLSAKYHKKYHKKFLKFSKITDAHAHIGWYNFEYSFYELYLLLNTEITGDELSLHLNIPIHDYLVMINDIEYNKSNEFKTIIPGHVNENKYDVSKNVQYLLLTMYFIKLLEVLSVVFMNKKINLKLYDKYCNFDQILHQFIAIDYDQNPTYLNQCLLYALYSLQPNGLLYCLRNQYDIDKLVKKYIKKKTVKIKPDKIKRKIKYNKKIKAYLYKLNVNIDTVICLYNQYDHNAFDFELFMKLNKLLSTQELIF